MVPISLRTIRSPILWRNQRGIHAGAGFLSPGLPPIYLGKTQTPRRADTKSFSAIGRDDNSDEISIELLPRPTTSTLFPIQSIGSKGERYWCEWICGPLKLPGYSGMRAAQ
jgi:hypothetical protein